MNADQLKSYGQTLATLEARLNRTLAHDRHELVHDDDPDFAGGPLPSTEDEPNDALHEVEIGLIQNESFMLNEVKAARQRIELGTFGQCEKCNKKISEARLAVVPYARHCIRCAQVEQATNN